MIDIDNIAEQLDCICYRNTAIVKVFSPFYMTIARNSEVKFLRNVVHIEDEWFLLVLKRGTDIDQVRAFFNSCKELVSDVQIV
jgi:hypothetical protein